jgi:hypothetical protein
MISYSILPKKRFAQSFRVLKNTMTVCRSLRRYLGASVDIYVVPMVQYGKICQLTRQDRGLPYLRSRKSMCCRYAPLQLFKLAANNQEKHIVENGRPHEGTTKGHSSASTVETRHRSTMSCPISHMRAVYVRPCWTEASRQHLLHSTVRT